MYGLLVELGPLWLNDLSFDAAFNATGIPSLVQNPYAWTKIGNVLMVDNSPPVGFSYCTQFGPSGNGTSCGPWNDTSVAIANANFYEEWFGNLFPEYAQHDIFFTGESYAGVYVPTIVTEILSRPFGQALKLKGVALGDSCLGTDVLCDKKLNLVGPYWDLIFFFGHGQLPNAFYTKIMGQCSIEELKQATQTPACAALVAEMHDIVAEYFEYNLYSYCPTNVGQRKRSTHRRNQVYNLPINGYPCPGLAMPQWIQRADVRRALNVPDDSFFFNADNGNGFHYDVTEKDVRPLVLAWAKNRGIRTLIYNGDADPSLSSFRTQDAWFPYLESNGLTTTQPWRAWTVAGQQDVRGYVQEWDLGVSYLTVRGSGHLVPEFRSQAIFLAMQNWVAGKDFPTYNKQSRRNIAR